MRDYEAEIEILESILEEIQYIQKDDEEDEFDDAAQFRVSDFI